MLGDYGDFYDWSAGKIVKFQPCPIDMAQSAAQHCLHSGAATLAIRAMYQASRRGGRKSIMYRFLGIQVGLRVTSLRWDLS